MSGHAIAHRFPVIFGLLTFIGIAFAIGPGVAQERGKSDPKLSLTLTWGDMTLELKGSANAVVRELERLKASGIGKLADFFELRDQSPDVPQPDPTPVPDPTPPPATETFQYAVSSWRLPRTPPEAMQVAANVDNDPGGRSENLFGQIVSILSTAELFGFGEVPAGPENGDNVPLLRLRTVDRMKRLDDNATVVLLRGRPTDPAGTFVLDLDWEPVTFFGRLIEGRFISDPRSGPATPLEVVIPEPLALQLQLIDPRLELTVSRQGQVSGALQGGILQDEFIGTFSSALARLFADRVANDPDSPETVSLLSVFGVDPDSDLPTTVDEWRILIAENAILQSLLQPDVMLDGRPGFSFAIGFDAAAATF